MKKKIILLSLLALTAIAGCGNSNNTESSSASAPTSQESSSKGETTSSSSEALKDFQYITYESLTVVYDGQEHGLSELSATNMELNGAEVEYKGYELHTDVGTYVYTAIVSKEGYNTKTYTATLTITPADFGNLEYESKKVTFDGNEHKDDIKLTGFIPADTTTKVTITDSTGKEVTSCVAAGTYNFKCVLSNKNYKSKTYTATLTIKQKSVDLAIYANSDGTVYFGNAMDKNRLYKVDKSGTITRLAFATPSKINKNSDGTIGFISNTSIIDTVKEISTTDDSVSSVITSGSISDYAKYSNNVYYYTSNSLLGASAGVYKVDNSGDEAVITKIYDKKASNLIIKGSFAYFIDESTKYITKINLTNNTSSVVLEEKVHEFVINGNNLYFNVNGTLNDYIGTFDVTSSTIKVTKLTNNAGEYLKINNGCLYYSNCDLTTKLSNDKLGIYKIDLTTKVESQVISSTKISGFDFQNSTTLMYISNDTYHIYKYNLSSKQETDLLANFEPIEDTPVNTGGQAVSYDGRIYYLNMYAGKTLYVYDEKNKTNYQLTSDKVADFYIYGDTLYFNQVTKLVNNDLYSINLKTDSEAKKLSSNDMRDMVSDGTYIYGTHYNALGAAGGIARMKVDGSEYVKFSDVNGAKNLTLNDGKLYYINKGTGQDNGDIEYVTTNSITSTTEGLEGTNLSSKVENVKQFILDGNDLYYIYNGTIENSIRKTNLTSLTNQTKIASSKTNPNEMILVGDYIYYYSYPATSLESAGFWKVSKNATEDKTQTMLFGYDQKYYGSNLVLLDNNLYFMNYIPKLVLGDAHTYKLNLSSKTITKLD